MKTLPLILVLFGLSIAVAGAWLYAPDKSVAELSPMYLRSRADLVEVAGMRVHVRDDGPRDAPVLVMLHGFAASLHTWEPWAAELASGFRVVRYDLPGFGLTGADPSGDYSDTRGLAVLAALMDKLGIARATLIGNSLGGRVAWKFAAAHPARVDRLVLISPDGYASPGFEYGKAPEVPATLQLMRFFMPAFMVRMSMAPAYADASVMDDALVRRYRDMMLATGVRAAILDRMRQAVLVEPQPILRTVQARTLLLWGEKDAMIPIANAQDYLRVLPSAVLVSLPGLGHLPQEEAPARSIKPVREFLR
jgi:pimeloyl-ACP methyl ester carboxylesterase